MNTSIETILEINTHTNADKLELAKVLGYQCVVPKGIYQVGDKIIFIKPDSVLPKDKEWAEPFLKFTPKRTKAIQLRGEWSEGIIMPIPSWIIDGDLDAQLEVTHYEPPIPTDINVIRNSLPFNIPKTDEERFENIYDDLPFGEIVDVTLKIDGQSCSYYYDIESDTFGVLTRGMELKEDALNKYTTHIGKSFNKDAFMEYCKKHNTSLCIRGESYGEGIQSMKHNPHSKEKCNIAFFSVYNITKRKYEMKGDEHYYQEVCEEIGLPQVPLLEESVILTSELIEKYSMKMERLEGVDYFEGVVVKGRNFSFKVINKIYDSLK